MPAGVLLHAPAALVQGVSGQPDDVERVHDRDRLGQFFGGGGLEAVKPSIATTSSASCHVWGRSVSQVLNACLDRPSTMSSSRAGPVPSRIPVRSMTTVAYLSP